MLQPNETLYLHITGIDNAFEAEQLIRLFHPGKIVLLASGEDGEKMASEVEAEKLAYSEEVEKLASGEEAEKLVSGEEDGNFQGKEPLFVSLNAWETTGHFFAQSTITACGERKGFSTASFPLEKTKKPSDIFLKSRKICAGTTLYNALEQTFQKSLPWGSLTGVRPVKLAAACLESGLDAENVTEMLQSRTGMDEDKARLLVTVAKNEVCYTDVQEKTLSLYIGIPFCASRCLYCSFTAYSLKQYGYQIPEYMCCLLKELHFVADWIENMGFTIENLYIGGGTPTALPLADLEGLLEAISELPRIIFAKNLEYTVEAGRPDTIDLDKLAAMKTAGVNRLSINPQTMHNSTLQRIGRNHTKEQVEAAFHMARQLGFQNINADLIAGLPGETPAMFRETLRWVKTLQPSGITVHTMAMKRGSRLHEAMVNGQSPPITPDADVVEMVDMAAAFARKNGYYPYYLYRQKNIMANLENVGYAKAGHECRYNIQTMAEKQTILALGSGGISKIVYPHKKNISIEAMKPVEDAAFSEEKKSVKDAVFSEEKKSLKDAASTEEKKSLKDAASTEEKKLVNDLAFTREKNNKTTGRPDNKTRLEIQRTFNVRELTHYIHRIDEMIARKQVLLDLFFVEGAPMSGHDEM